MDTTQAERQRRFRKTNPDAKREIDRRYREANRDKIRVGKRVQNRVTRRKWPHASVFRCTDCGRMAAHYHHEDYSLWWSVEPLCNSCHGKRHAV
jgi:hypothetical protein